MSADRSSGHRVVLRFEQNCSNDSCLKLMNVIQDEILTGASEVVLLISSTGGNVHWGLTTAYFFQGLPVDTVTHSLAAVESVAVPLYAAGKRRLALPDSSFMFHEVGFNATNNQRSEFRDIETKLKSLENDHRRISGFVGKACGVKPEKIREYMRDYTYLNTEEAMEMGLVHEIKETLFEPRDKMIVI